MDKIESIRHNTQQILDLLTNRELKLCGGFPARPYIIAIDGRCGAGKTTLSVALRNAIERRVPKPVVTLIHMDDFYLRIEQRTEARFKLPGGNIDHERFKDEVLQALIKNEAFSYHPFDCAFMEPGEPIAVYPSHVAIIEGSYSLHPELREEYDLKVFLDIDPDEQKTRILERNGEEKLKQFIERWIPFEELYFSNCGVCECADIVLK